MKVRAKQDIKETSWMFSIESKEGDNFPLNGEKT